jgi:hypothetical protein
MAVAFSPNLLVGLNDAFNRLLVDAGLNYGALGTASFSQLISQGLQGQVMGTTVVSGSSYTPVVSDSVILMTDDAARTVALPVFGAGTVVTIVDDSGSTTAGHTITVTPASGSVYVGGASHATIVVTPATNSSIILLSDGINYYCLART